MADICDILCEMVAKECGAILLFVNGLKRVANVAILIEIRIEIVENADYCISFLRFETREIISLMIISKAPPKR